MQKMSGSSTGLGVMSGSSLDGIDLAVVNFENGSYKIIESQTLSLDSEIKSALTQISMKGLKSYLLLEKRFTEFVSTGILSQIRNEYDFIAVHGHTTLHLPNEGITHQMINGGILSALCGKPVITDFRIGDIALGGVGTPLVPKLEKDLFPGFDYYLNLGGIANLSRSKDWVAFDVCPCNQLSNFVARKMGMEYDQDGQIASTGTMDNELYKLLDDFDFYQGKAPKSLDNGWIQENYFPLLQNIKSSNEDLLNTINHWIVDKIGLEVENDKTVFCSGGGVYNRHLMELLKKKNLIVKIPDHQIVDFKEALLMAYLGYLRIQNKSNVLSSVTGASMDSIGGSIYNIHGN